MKESSIAVRRFNDLLIRIIASFAALVGIFFLGWILYVVLSLGFEAIIWQFVTELPAPPGIPDGPPRRPWWSAPRRC